MNCSCLKEIEKSIVEEQPYEGRKVINAYIERKLIHKGPKVVSKTFSTVRLMIKGRARKETEVLLHAYCPFCGAPIEEKK